MTKQAKPLPISHTGLRRTRGGVASTAPTSAPGTPLANQPKVQELLKTLERSLQEIRQQPTKPIARPIASPLEPLE